VGVIPWPGENMRQSLRRTLAHLNLLYGDGAVSQGVVGRRFTLEARGNELTLWIDLTPNFQTRNTRAQGYVDAQALTRNHDRLRVVQCDDNLVRTRLVRAWEALHGPQLAMVLDLGPRGAFAYAVRPRLLFTGGVQLDVLQPMASVPPGRHLNDETPVA
jgi:hypothetical protein